MSLFSISRAFAGEPFASRMWILIRPGIAWKYAVLIMSIPPAAKQAVLPFWGNVKRHHVGSARRSRDAPQRRQLLMACKPTMEEKGLSDSFFQGGLDRLPPSAFNIETKWKKRSGEATGEVEQTLSLHGSNFQSANNCWTAATRRRFIVSFAHMFLFLLAEVIGCAGENTPPSPAIEGEKQLNANGAMIRSAALSRFPARACSGAVRCKRHS